MPSSCTAPTAICCTQFVSPLSNHRKDDYGGSLENRMRFPLEVARAVRVVVPRSDRARRAHHRHGLGGRRARGGRCGGLRCRPQGCRPRLHLRVGRRRGAARQDRRSGPATRCRYAAKVKAATGIVTRAVGLIATPEQAEAIVGLGAGRLRGARARLPRRRPLGVARRRAPRRPRLDASAVRACVAHAVARRCDGSARVGRDQPRLDRGRIAPAWYRPQSARDAAQYAALLRPACHSPRG